MKNTKTWLSKLTALSFCLIVFQLAPSCLTSKTKVTKKHYSIADRILQAVLEEEKGHKLLRELSHFGPRLSGSENSLKAIHWAQAKMKELGFDRVWLQPVMVPCWVRGNVEEAVLARTSKEKYKLNIAALGGSVGTTAIGIGAEVVEVKSFDELNALGEAARGKIVFYNFPMPKGLLDTVKAYEEAVTFRVSGAIEAAKVGGVAAVVRSITTKYDNAPHLGMSAYKDGVPKIPSVSIGQTDADYLSKAVREDSSLKVNLKLSCKTLSDIESYNVIGEIHGSEKPNEVIVIGAHLDSWDAGDGSHDDGGGCVQAMEVLDLFRRLDIIPKRTLRCVFFINEENGLRGAMAYADYVNKTNEIHVAAIESDRGMFMPREFAVLAKKSILKCIKKWLPAMEKAGIMRVRSGEGGKPDILSIKNAKARIGFIPDNQRYFDFHHSANDIFNAVNPREMELGTAAIAILAYMICEEGL